MSAESGSVGIGARLRAARERKGLTVLQAAEKLHVDAKVLEALDAENFQPLGADVYVRGHLRRYAELVGESPGELQDLYASSGLAVRPDLTRIARAERPSESSRLMLPALLAVIGLTLAGLLWWMLTLPKARPQALAASPVAAAPATETPAVAPEGAEAAPVASAAPAPAPPATPGATPALGMKLSGASWVQVADARGHVVLDGLLPAGSSRSVTGTPPLHVVLGNAAAVKLDVNGRAVSLEGLVRKRGDARLLVDAAGQISAPQPRSGTGD